MRLKRYLPAAILVLGTAVAVPACGAQTYGYRGGYTRDLERRAYDSGFRDGVKAANKDVRERRAFGPERHDDWRDADDGYHRDYGDKEIYRRAFRDGFRAGYSETFNRYAGGVYRGPAVAVPPPVVVAPGRAPAAVYVSRAADVGYRDGLEAGRTDAHDRRQFDPRRSSRYRSADHGYDGHRDGPKDAYKDQYRDAFQRGYEAGYGRR